MPQTQTCPIAEPVPETLPRQIAEAAMRASAFQAGLQALREALGAEHVVADAAACRHAGRTTLPDGAVPRAIVRPGSTEDVQAAMRISRRYRLPVSPVSTGKNWGYGDACPAGAGQILLDLSRMNRLVALNEELAYATVEPGVTQGQLAEALAQGGHRLWMDATGAGPDTSLIGNTLERGFGHSEHGDRFQHVCGLEVVLPDGRILRTGFGHFDGARSAEVYRWGVGPFLDGLFTQASFGVVTRMTFWLRPKPEAFRACFFRLERDEDLPALVDALRRLRLNGTLRMPVHVANDLRMIAMNEPYPWDAMHGVTPLAHGLRLALRRKHGVGAWCGSAGLYGSCLEVAAAAREVRRVLRGVPGLRLLVLGERSLRCARSVRAVCERLGLFKTLRTTLEKIEMGFRLLQGISPRVCLQGGLWRTRTLAHASEVAQAQDPRDAGAGFLWLSPVIPATRDDVQRLHAVVEPIFAKHRFEYQATLTMVTERALCAVTTVCFDKQDPADAARARACHDELLEALLAAGYPPYRAGRRTAPMLRATSQVFFDVADELKHALDPDDLLAPGRY